MFKNFKKVSLIILIIFLIVIAIYPVKKLLSKQPQEANNPPGTSSNQQSKETTQSDSKKVSIVSTNPDPLDNIIINSGQVIEINFSNPLENTGEFKHRITPAADYKLELTGDRKTLKIVPVKPYELGNEFTLVISPETKFDNGARMEHEAIYHFHTVAFRNL